MAPQDSVSTTTTIRVEYKAPTVSKTFAHVLPSAVVISTTEKIAYLSALRGLVVQTQEEVNAFLTAKMEEDKAVVSLAGAKSDEKKAEEDYGEEVVDEDD
ncbi:hypothetical protein MMC07_007456 [Pseudocyphellaria aurata]|nr:hypothetical protein [Pseudocyphellaria aurata]